MEEILRKLQRDASGSKYKAIKESCTWALGKQGQSMLRRRGGEGVSGDALQGPWAVGIITEYMLWMLLRNSKRCLGELIPGMKILARSGHPAASIWSPYLLPNLSGNPCLCPIPIPGSQLPQTWVPQNPVRTSCLCEIMTLVPKHMEGKRKFIKSRLLIQW